MNLPARRGLRVETSRRRTGQISTLKAATGEPTGVHFREENGHARAGQVLRGLLNPPMPWCTLGIRVVPLRARARRGKMGGR